MNNSFDYDFYHDSSKGTMKYNNHYVRREKNHDNNNYNKMEINDENNTHNYNNYDNQMQKNQKLEKFENTVVKKLIEKINLLIPTIILITTTLITHVYRDEKKLSMRDIMLLLSPTLPTILPIIIGILTEILEVLLNTLLNFGFPFEKIFNIENLKIFNKFYKHKSEIQQRSTIIKQQICESHEFKTQVSTEFIQSLISYITKSQNVKYEFDKNKKEFNIESKNSLTRKSILKNVIIQYNNVNISFNDLEIVYSKMNDDIILEDYKILFSENAVHLFNKMTRIVDFIKNINVKEMIESLSNNVMNEFFGMFQNSREYGFDNFCEGVLIESLKDTCPNINKSLFICDFIVVDIIFCIMFGGLVDEYGKTNSHSHMLNDIINSFCNDLEIIKLFDYDVPCLKSQHMKQYAFVCHTTRFFDQLLYDVIRKKIMNSYTNIIIENKTLIFTECKKYLTAKKYSDMENTQNTNLKEVDKNIKLLDVNFNVIPLEKTLKDEKIDEIFEDFLKTIQKHKLPIINGQKIKIYNTKIIKNEIVTKDANPEYDIYMEKKSLLMSMKKDNNTESDKLQILLDNDIPPKELIQKTIESSIVTKHVSDKFKSFDTLYLRENDMNSLLGILNKFKNSNSLFEEFGLPNKLGILLHGQPGTGKTTTIHAIASFLQKNIFYVNLSTVDSNDELQSIFDHVLVDAVGSGIIVFEDIDAMTNIVFDRTLNSIVNEKLTLEYFLNLLQGSLTRDGTIFIATTNHLEKIDPAFHRTGRFDVKIDMKLCDHYQIKIIYQRFVKKHIDQNILDMIPIDKYSPAEIIFHLVNFIESDLPCEVIMKKFIENN